MCSAVASFRLDCRNGIPVYSLKNNNFTCTRRYMFTLPFYLVRTNIDGTLRSLAHLLICMYNVKVCGRALCQDSHHSISTTHARSHIGRRTHHFNVFCVICKRQTTSISHLYSIFIYIISGYNIFYTKVYRMLVKRQPCIGPYTNSVIF